MFFLNYLAVVHLLLYSYGHVCLCSFETALFKLEILDHKARERAGIITPTLGSPVPVLLQFDAAAEVEAYSFS